jgi:nucleoside-diphosphate-sugar epimerase
MTDTISILGCGWLGLPLGEVLAEKGYKVKGSTTTESKLENIRAKGIEPYLITVAEELEGEKARKFFDSQLLVLALPPAGRKDPDVENNYPRKVQAILNHAQAGNIRQLLFISTTGVYADNNDITDESARTLPTRPSGRAVLTAERLLALQNGLDITVLRMAGLVGGDRKAGRFLAGKQNVPNGGAPVNLVHLDDCIEIIQKLIERDCWNTVLNVCSDKHPTRAEFYTHRALVEGFEPPSFADHAQGNFKIISNRKLKDTLDYQFIHPDPMLF